MSAGGRRRARGAGEGQGAEGLGRWAPGLASERSCGGCYGRSDISVWALVFFQGWMLEAKVRLC